MTRLHKKKMLHTTVVLTLLLVATGCQVRSPGSFETRVMESTKRRLTIGGRSDVNPLPPTADNIHADKMAPPVPPLNSAAVQAYTDGQLHRVISDGIFPSGMPASKAVFRDVEIWQLVLYVRHLPPKGSLGEPQVYGGSGCPEGNCPY